MLKMTRTSVRTQHSCPACAARVGEPCVGARGRARVSLHQERWNVALLARLTLGGPMHGQSQKGA
jgi:hypothetical protein